MPIYEFECPECKDKKAVRITVPEYVELMKKELLCDVHKGSRLKRVYSSFTFRM